MKILLVDDEHEDISTPYLMTSKLGHDITLAFDGERALHDLSRQKFDLIILDWNMPVMGGDVVLRALGQMDRKNINVVLYSGLELRYEAIPKAKNIQLLDIWQKPMTCLEILKRMKSISSRMRKR